MSMHEECTGRQIDVDDGLSRSGYHAKTIIKSQQINRYAHHEWIYIYITVRKINYASREL